MADLESLSWFAAVRFYDLLDVSTTYTVLAEKASDTEVKRCLLAFANVRWYWAEAIRTEWECQ